LLRQCALSSDNERSKIMSVYGLFDKSKPLDF
jgi:hypothetical protein